MADNKQLPATGTGTANIVVGTDEITGVDYQQIKLVNGTLGSTTAAIVDANGSLQTTLLGAGGEPAAVTEGGFLQVELGNVAANLLGSQVEDTAAADSSSAIAILGVRNDADAARTSTDGDYGWLSLDDTGRVKTLNAGTQVLGTDTYTEATSKGLTVGAVRRDADTTLVNTTNEFGPLQMDANGRLKVEAFSGETLPTSLATLPALVAGSANIGDVDVVTLPALVAGTANIGDVDVLTVPADPFGVNADAASGTGSISAKLRLQAAAALVGDAAATATPTGIMEVGLAKAAAPTDVSADNDAVAAWRLRNGAAATVLTAAGALVGGDATNGLDVDVTRIVPGTGATNLGKAEDAVAGDGDTGVLMLGVRNDGPSSRTGSDGDYSAISVDDNGRPRVVIDAFNPGTMTTKLSSPTGTLSNVSASASSVTVLASNGNRRGASIWNDSTAICYLKFGATASTTSCTVKLIADAYYEVPFGYTGIIDGIWASATGSARVTEIT